MCVGMIGEGTHRGIVLPSRYHSLGFLTGVCPGGNAPVIEAVGDGYEGNVLGPGKGDVGLGTRGEPVPMP